MNYIERNSEYKRLLQNAIRYLLLTKFEVCTVSYELSLFRLSYGPYPKHVGHKATGKKNVTYSMDQENKVSKIFSMSLRLIGHVGKETFKFSRLNNLKYGLQNWPITVHILTQRYNIKDSILVFETQISME